METITILSYWMVVVWIILALPACSGNSPEQSVLEGKVSVGPLTPVERELNEGVVPTPIPAEVFTSRSLDIYKPGGKILVKNVPFLGDGTYRVELKPGKYVVALPSGGIEFAKDLPKEIELEAGKTYQMDINIDTGIR